MIVGIFIGDIDEFYGDSKDGDHQRIAVWSNVHVKEDSFPQHDPEEDCEASGLKRGYKVLEKLLGRFETMEEAVEFAEKYDPGEGNTKAICY